MNQQFYSIFFSALLTSTFIHEINSKAAPKPAEAAPAAIAAPMQMLERAAGTPPNCTLICCADKSTNLSILANADANLQAIVNLTANVGLILDINANLAVLLNGKTGVAIVLKLSTNEVVYISGGVWLAVRVSFKAYLASLKGGLAVLLNISGAVVYKVGSVPPAVLNEINAILVFLIVNLSVAIRNDAKVGLQLIITICIRKIQFLSGPLLGFTKVVGTSIISINADLVAILNICEGLSIIFGKISGGLQAVIKAGVVLNLQVIANLANGIDRLVVIIIALSLKINIGDTLGDLLNDVELLFTVIALLGGNVNYGISGLFKVLATIVACTKKKVTIEVVITIVLLFIAYSSQSVTEDLTVTLQISLKALLDAVNKAGAAKALVTLVATITALIEGTLVIAGVNISAIVAILLTGVIKGIEFLLQVLVLVVLQLVVLIDNVLGLLYCLLILIFQCNSPVGLEILKAIGISVDLSIEGIVGSIIRFILQSLSSIVKLLLGDLYGALITVPVIGQIIITLNVAIKAATGGKFDLANLLNLNTIIKSFIRALFQLLANINLFIDVQIVAQVKAMLEKCTSVSIYVGINVSVVIGVAI